jgi:hypothetical protein
MEGIKIKKLLTLQLFFLTIVTIGCSSYTKDDYLNDFTNFILDVEIEYKNYSMDDWEERNLEFQQFTDEYYQQYKEELTTEDRKQVAKLKAKYQTIIIKHNAKELIDGISDGLNLLEGVVDGVLEEINNQ